MKMQRLKHHALLSVLAATLMLSCNQQELPHTDEEQVDSLLCTAHKNHDYQRLLELSDSLQTEGDITTIQANYWRGYAYSRQKMMRLAEKYWRQAINSEIVNHEGLVYYAKSANRLSGALLAKGDYESTIKVVLPALEKMIEEEYCENNDYAYLQTALGCCQLKQGSPYEAEENFQKSYALLRSVIGKDPTRANFSTAIVSVIYITENYLQQNCSEEAYEWTQKFRELLNFYEGQPHPNAYFLDKQLTRFHIYQASALEGMGRHEEGRKVFDEARKMKFFQTDEGRLEANNYLMAAGLWTEAADNFEVLDKQMQTYDINTSMDIIQQYLLQKYRANMGAHRTEAANSVSRHICDRLDSAIILMRRDAALELTTIYNTQQKEREMAKEKAHMALQHYLITVLALVIVLICFGLILYLHHHASVRLKKAYANLSIANERTQESSRMKTSFIRQMSHEIRTPLNILSGFTQLITAPDMQLDEATRQDINQQIMENTHRITELVNKMLELSDISSKTVIERNDQPKVAEIAIEAVNSIDINEQAVIPIALQMDDQTAEKTLQTNEQAATRALVLLLDNAERFTKQGSVTLRIDSDDQQVRFVVEDTGIGIPASEAEHIFEEFVQLNEYEEGTGIGLTVARSICRRLGGDIVLDTTYTDGARFVMTLPVSMA